MEEQRAIFENFISERYGAGANKSKTVTREKGERIVQVLKNDPAAASYDAKFKHWIHQRNFQVVSFAALGLKDVLCLPSKTTVSSSSSQGHALASTRTRWGWGSGWPVA